MNCIILEAFSLPAQVFGHRAEHLQPIACQLPLSIGFSRWEYWSGLPFPASGDLLHLGIKPGFPTLQADTFPVWATSKPVWTWKWKSLSHVWLFATPWTRPWNSPGQNTGVGCLSLLQGIFPTQGSNPGLPHYSRFLTSWAAQLCSSLQMQECGHGLVQQQAEAATLVWILLGRSSGTAQSRW